MMTGKGILAMDKKAYIDGFNPREYFVMIECEHNGKSHAELAKQLGVSRNRINQMYNHAKRKQAELYSQAIEEAIGKAGPDRFGLLHEYGSTKYVIAYLEREYKDILSDFRNGEPESVYHVPGNMPAFCQQLTTESRFNTKIRLKHLPLDKRPYIRDKNSGRFYRIALNRSELLVLRAKDVQKKDYKEIGAQFEITNDAAKKIYLSAKSVILHKKIAVVCEMTEHTFDEITDEFIKKDIRFTHWRKQTEYIEQTYKQFLSQKPIYIAVFNDCEMKSFAFFVDENCNEIEFSTPEKKHVAGNGA